MSPLWWIQIAADLVLAAAVALLLLRLRRRGQGGLPPAPKELERFVTEARGLAQEFDRLLSEKRELVNTTLSTLDARIAQMQKMVQELEDRLAQSRSQPAAALDVDGMAAFRRKVLELSRQGLDPARIAEATGRPRGEVELVLGLSSSS